MDALSNLWDARTVMLWGGFLAIWAIADFVKSRKVSLWAVPYILGVISFVAVGLIDLLGIVDQASARTARNAVFGTFFLIVGSAGLFSRTTQRVATWLCVALGVVVLLTTLISGPGIYSH